MNKLSFLIVTLLLIACGCNAPKVNDQTDNNRADSARIAADDSSKTAGSDRDTHGCIPSAGYTWSEINKECVRIWEVGKRFRAYGDNKDSTTAAYLITQPNTQAAELFLPGQKGSTILAATDESMDLKASMYVCQNEDSSIYLKFHPSQEKYVLYIDKKPMFVCAYPLK